MRSRSDSSTRIRRKAVASKPVKVRTTVGARLPTARSIRRSLWSKYSIICASPITTVTPRFSDTAGIRTFSRSIKRPDDMAVKHIKIGKKVIGRGAPVLIVAEMSGNHNGDIRRALKIIDAAADAGADAVKLQTYTPDTMTIDSDKPYFKIKSKNKDWRGKTLYELYAWAQTPWRWHKELFAHAKKRGLLCFSTPF